MSRRRRDRSGRNSHDRKALLNKVIVLELMSLGLVTLPMLIGGTTPAVGICIALLLQLDVACAAVGKD